MKSLLAVGLVRKLTCATLITLAKINETGRVNLFFYFYFFCSFNYFNDGSYVELELAGGP